MHKNSRFLLILLLISTVISCRSQSQENQVEDLMAKGKYKYFESFKTFANSPKSIIPDLIKAIDTDVKDLVGLPNPRSSRFWPNLDNYVGIRAAYAIEYIIADSSRVKDIKNGIILKMRKGEPVYEPLTLDDMKEIKEIYKNWWQKSKDKSIADLKKQWSFERPILVSDKFEWY